MDLAGMSIEALLEEHVRLDGEIEGIRAQQKILSEAIIAKEAAAFRPGPAELHQGIGSSGPVQHQYLDLGGKA